MSKDTVTVCAACLTATCWMGISFCDKSRTAGTVEKTPELLKELNLEHSDYWVYGKGEEQ